MAINWKNVAKWRDELRSGKWKQTTGATYTRFNNSFCCLGVFQFGVYKDDHLINTGYLTQEAAESLGCLYLNPNIFGENTSHLNDRDRLTFDEIADLLDIALIEKAGIDDGWHLPDDKSFTCREVTK